MGKDERKGKARDSELRCHDSTANDYNSAENENKIIKTYMNGLLQTEISRNPDDIPEIMDIEKKCWEELSADAEKFLIRQKHGVIQIIRSTQNSNFHISRNNEKKVVRARKGQILGHLTAYPARWTNGKTIYRLNENASKTEIGKIKWKKISEEFELPKNWHKATMDGWLEKDGKSVIDNYSDVIHLISTCVDPEYRGKINGTSMIDSLMDSLEVNSKSNSALYIIGYTTLPGYKKFSEQLNMSADEYMFNKFDERYIDKNINYHARNGAKIICAIPNCMKEDKKSLGNGALVLYDLEKA